MNKLDLFNRYLLIKIFFSLIFLNYFYFSSRITLRENAWITGDWLINYDGGLLRRGLSGEIILLLSNFKFINIYYLIIFIQSSLFFIFLFFLWKLISKKEVSLIFLFLIFSPVTIAFSFYDPLVVGRKEVIFFASYTLYVLYFLKNKNYSIYKNLGFLLTGVIFVLIHEIFLFFSSFYLFSKFCFLKINNQPLKFKNLSYEFNLIIGSLTSFIILVYFSSNNPELKTLVCNQLLEKGFSKEICLGAIQEIVFSKYINYYKSFELLSYIKNYNYLNVYILSITLFFLPYAIFLYKQRYNKINLKILFLFLIFQLLFLGIIFFVVNDWGRYLNIYFIHILIFSSYFFLKSKRKVNSINFYSIITYLILVIYSLGWHMPHCCQKNLGDGIFSFKDRISYRINNPSTYEDKTRKLIIDLIK